MANVKISALTAAGGVAGSDVLPLVQGGVTKQAAFSLLPISTAAQTALNLKANLASPTFTGTVVTPALDVVGTNGNASFSTTGDQLTFSRNGFNYVTATGAAATLRIQATGATGQLSYLTGGTGVHTFSTNTNDIQFQVAHTASSVNWLAVQGSTTGNRTLISAIGSDANIGIAYIAKGTGSNAFYGNGTALQFNVASVASSVNYMEVYGAATTFGPNIRANGSDTNIQMNLRTKGTGAFFFNTNDSVPQLTILHAASAVNYWQFNGNIAGARIQATAVGADTNIGIAYSAKGVENHVFRTGGGTNISFNVYGLASSVNYVSTLPSATGNGVSVLADGTDTNVNLILSSRGTGTINASTSGGTQFMVGHIASAVNYVQATGNATGGGVTISAQGSDTNIDVQLNPKGTGNVRFGTNTVNADAPVIGYITIKDSGGTTRKLAVIA